MQFSALLMASCALCAFAAHQALGAELPRDLLMKPYAAAGGHGDGEARLLQSASYTCSNDEAAACGDIAVQSREWWYIRSCTSCGGETSPRLCRSYLGCCTCTGMSVGLVTSDVVAALLPQSTVNPVNGDQATDLPVTEGPGTVVPALEDPATLA